MKKFFTKHWFALITIILFALGAFLRLYNFPNRVIFGPEQAISLITSAANLSKFSLLGEINLIRSSSAGHSIFHGAYYSYLLLPFLVLFNFRVLPLAFIFALLNLATAFVLLLICKKLFSKTIALLTLFYFLFSDVMIHHSLFPWIVNPTPLLSTASLWLLAVLVKNKRSLILPVLLGFFSGLGFGMQNLYLPFAIIIILAVFFISKIPLFAISTYLFGFLLGNLPTVIFDLRHDFYHLRTFWQFFLDAVFHQTASGSLSYYNFLYLYPFLFIFLAFVTRLLFKIFPPLALLVPLLFLQLTFSSPLFNLYRSTGMAPGLTLAKLEQAAATIAADQPPPKFNVATLWDFDTRAHPLRYLLKYYYKYTPQPYENYADVDALYVFAPADYDIAKPAVWELKTYLPYQVKELPSPTSAYRLYKLTK